MRAKPRSSWASLFVFLSAISTVGVVSGLGGCHEFGGDPVNFTVVGAVQSSANAGGGGASSTMSSGGAGGMGGEDPVSGAGGGQETFAGPEDYFDKRVKADMKQFCGKCHTGGSPTFLLLNDEYNSITQYTISGSNGLVRFVVKDVDTSVLLTYPSSSDHSEPKIWEKPDLGDLKARVRKWLELESKNIVENPFLEVGPFVPNGLTVLPLDAIGFKGAKMAMYAQTYGDPPSLLELSNIEVYPEAGKGLRIDDISFVTVPPQSDAPQKLDTTLHGEPIDFVAPSQVSVGLGKVFITGWSEGSSLKVRVDSIEELLADEFGNVFVKCKSTPTFTAVTDAMPLVFQDNAVNGPLFCATYCHGGSFSSPSTGKMSLTSLLSIPRDDELACAKVRAFIAPSEPGEMDASLNPSEIIALTKPGNASGHPFTFQGNSGSHSAFASTMLQWIEAEFPPEN